MRLVPFIRRVCKPVAVLLSLVICVVGSVHLVGCSTTQKADSARVRLLCSFYPIYIMALNITDGVDGVQLDVMAPNQTGCLHDYQLQTEDMKNLESADGFLINGAGMESFLDKVTQELPELTVVDSSTGIPLIAAGETHSHDHESHEQSEEEEEVNPHLWVSISNCIQQVNNLTEGICQLDPAYADSYRANAQAYTDKLSSLRDEMHAQLDGLPNRDIITFHEAFPYFAEEFDLNIAAVVNREPDSEPSAKELADTILLVRSTNVKALFVEPQYPTTSAEIVANETGAAVYVLDPAVSGDMDKDAYLHTMEQNLQVLRQALA